MFSYPPMRAGPRQTPPAGRGRTGHASTGRPWLAIASVAATIALAVVIVIVATRPPAATGTATLQSEAATSAVATPLVPPTAPTTSLPQPTPLVEPTPRATRSPGIPTPTMRPTIAPPALPAGLRDGLPTGDPAPARASAPPPPASRPPVPSAVPVKRSREPEELTGYDWPLYRGRMTSYFGSRSEGFLVVDGERIHSGLDTTTWCGDKVKAAHKGVVLAAGRRWAHEAGFRGSVDEFHERLERRGEMRLLPIAVIIDDGNGYRSMYVHLSQATVKVGQKVRKGQVIGLEGMTGNATGCHVHYELIRMDGRWMRVASALVREYRYPRWQRERVDPLRVLDMRQKRAGRKVPGIERPRLPPSLRGPGTTDD